MGDSVPDDEGADLSGLEPDQPTDTAEPELVEADYPGLEPTSGERIDQATEQWGAELDAAAERYQWTEEELDKWAEDPRVRELIRATENGATHYYSDPRVQVVNQDLHFGLRAIDERAGDHPVFGMRGGRRLAWVEP